MLTTLERKLLARSVVRGKGKADFLCFPVVDGMCRDC